jgi:20S proteasome alpha/beta subunit
MENNIMLNLIKCMEETPERTYDFICNNYWNMSKEELKDVAKELLYEISRTREEGDILERIAEELKDSYIE